MQFQRPPTAPLTNQFRGMRNGFLAGLIIGMLIGWFFHGFVGLVVRFGFVLLLLIPLAFVVWFFFLRNRAAGGQQPGAGGMQVYTWRSGEGGQRYTGDPREDSAPGKASRQARNEDEIIDLEFEELKRKSDRDE